MNAPSRRTGSARARTATRAARVADAIRQAILDGRLGEGERLVEQRLADALGVSRQPVRDALRLLARERLVELASRHGARVAMLSHETACEIVEVACALERLDAKLAARRRDVAFVAAAGVLLAAGDEACADARADALRTCTNAGSDLIRAAASNHALADLLAQIRDRTRRAMSLLNEDARESWREQSALVRAVAAGDAELAALLAQGRARRAGARFLARDRSPCVVCRRGFPLERRPQTCPAVAA